jgi:hypothetical protein
MVLEQSRILDSLPTNKGRKNGATVTGLQIIRADCIYSCRLADPDVAILGCALLPFITSMSLPRLRSSPRTIQQFI